MAHNLVCTLRLTTFKQTSKHCGAHLITRVGILLYTLKRKAKFLAQRQEIVIVTLVATTQTMVIAHDHTHHTELCDKRLTDKLLERLATKGLIEVCNHHVVNAIATKQQSTLLDRCKQAHTLSTPHSDARMWLKGHNSTLRIETLGKRHHPTQQHMMTLVDTVKRAHSDHRTQTLGQRVEAVVNLHN